MPGSKFVARLRDLSDKAGLNAVAVAFYDYESDLRFSFHGDRWFHAASTFKAAVLLALFKAGADERLELDAHLQIRNRFLSAADRAPFRIDRSRDGDAGVHGRIGRSMKLEELARTMITHSSNLATNLLLDFLTVEYVRDVIVSARIQGLEIRRGVEDFVAHEQGLNNEATADGLLELFRVFQEPGFLPEPLRQKALDILLAQEFRRMIPARLPAETRVAHKTGEISTHSHDAGIIFPLGRAPYLLAILTESDPQNESRTKAVAEISATVFRTLIGLSKERTKAGE